MEISKNDLIITHYECLCPCCDELTEISAEDVEVKETVCEHCEQEIDIK